MSIAPDDQVLQGFLTDVVPPGHVLVPGMGTGLFGTGAGVARIAS